MAKRDISRLEKALSELNKCNPNNLMGYLTKFQKYFEVLKEAGFVRGYNLGSPYARPDPGVILEIPSGKPIKLCHILL